MTHDDQDQPQQIEDMPLAWRAISVSVGALLVIAISGLCALMFEPIGPGIRFDCWAGIAQVCDEMKEPQQ